MDILPNLDGVDSRWLMSALLITVILAAMAVDPICSWCAALRNSYREHRAYLRIFREQERRRR